MAAPGFLDSISPWNSRSTTPKPPSAKDDGASALGILKTQQGVDHTVSHRPRLKLGDYPNDCPPLNARWFYAVDVPKRKPLSLDKPTTESKTLPKPKKFVSFSINDSRSIENAFQRLAEEEEEPSRREQSEAEDGDIGAAASNINEGPKKSATNKDLAASNDRASVKVPVNEDFLFDVDIENRELAPTYWLGPIYDVRRGSWFYQEGSSLRPCDENLATQLEEGYLKIKPWRYEPASVQRSSSQQRSRPTSWRSKPLSGSPDGSGSLHSVQTQPGDEVKSTAKEEALNVPVGEPKFQLQAHRLFGTHMNSVVTYQDATVAWLLTDDFLSRMSSSVYQRFAGGGHLGGLKMVRGYVEVSKPKEGKVESESQVEHGDLNERGRSRDQKRRSAPPSTERPPKDVEGLGGHEDESESKRSALERRMATMVASPGPEDPASQEEELRKRDEKEIQDDYRDADGEDQAREVEHLILVTHGIGQRLGIRMESVNFIHDVNVLRKTLKSVYENSPDLQGLNAEVDKLPKNCRVQVLPVVWRHLLDFPKQSLRQSRKEQDLTDADAFEIEEDYPSLNDITVEGVPAIRNLITDLALDILLYQSAYREHIAGIVQRECNRIYNLFLQRNPRFNGKVSLIGHSLGSAIIFDILCRQKETSKAHVSNIYKRRSKQTDSSGHTDDDRDLGLDFEVEDFYCLGSPLGLFQMLKGRTIAGRRSPDAMPAESPMDPDSMDDPFLGASAKASAGANKSSLLAITTSSPKCAQLFNIFHPADPIAYRIEPLISPAMSSLKPQPLPYTKRGLFGAPGQGLTGIGVRVGQSVSGLWSNITTGVASSLLNRSLGLTAEGQSSTNQSATGISNPKVITSAGAGTNISAGGVIAGPDVLEEERKRLRSNTGNSEGRDIQHPPTLLDTEIETLYAGFQKRRKSQPSDSGRDVEQDTDWQEAEQRARRLRREESKVRALNKNGRVDFSIQEGVFDISLIASIASHLTYWADEDVSHFMISQLLSKQRVWRR